VNFIEKKYLWAICTAIFSLQREILKNKKLTAEDKVKMLEASINATIGKEIEDE
jgi:hypothetical protein